MNALCDVGGARPVSRFADLKSGRIHYLEIGHGKPLVLIHGAGGGAANWFHLFAPLSQTHRVLALDLPGFGLSDPIEPHAPLGEQAAAVISEWMDSLTLPQALFVSTSFGGLASLRFAQHNPARVERLVLIDTAGAGAEYPPLVGLANLSIAPLFMAPSRRGTRWLLRRLMVSRPLAPETERALVEYLYESAKRSGTQFMVRALRKFTSRVGQAEQPTMAELAGVTVPAMVVWGTKDRFFPVHHATSLQLRLPNARVVEIDAGHSPNWESPDLLLAAIQEFLTDTH